MQILPISTSSNCALSLIAKPQLEKGSPRGIQQEEELFFFFVFCFFLIYHRTMQFNHQSSWKAQGGGHPHPSLGPSRARLPVCRLRVPKVASLNPRLQIRARCLWNSAGVSLLLLAGKKLKSSLRTPLAPRILPGFQDVLQVLAEQGREQSVYAIS